MQAQQPGGPCLVLQFTPALRSHLVMPGQSKWPLCMAYRAAHAEGMAGHVRLVRLWCLPRGVCRDSARAAAY